MSVVNEQPSQLVLPSLVEVIDVNGLYGLEPDSRITLGRLARLAGEGAEIQPEPTVSEYESAEPETINRGLYIPYNDSRYTAAQQLVRLGVDPTARPFVQQNVGVVFPASEFHVVARNARDLANHTAAVTRRANESVEDRDEVHAKVGRSIAHALTSKIDSLDDLDNRLKTERATLRSLHKDAGSAWQAHYKVKNLEPKRKFADERIHEATEVAAINLNHGTITVKGIHRVIKKRLYGSNQSQAEIGHNWQRYIRMVGVYTGARIHKISLSKDMCESELYRYQHFLQARATQV